MCDSRPHATHPLRYRSVANNCCVLQYLLVRDSRARRKVPENPIADPVAKCGLTPLSKLTKPPVRWLGGGAASGGSELHGGTPAAHRSLRIFRQSRRLPCRGGAGT